MKQALAIVINSLLTTVVLVGGYYMVARWLGLRFTEALLLPLALAVFWVALYSRRQRSRSR